MGLFDWLFGNRPKEPDRRYEETFKMLNGYVPRFTSYSGGMYESELVRAAINTIATHISKLNVETRGAAKPALQNKLKHGPNEFQSWSQFMYRAATILYNCNTLFIVPILDRYGQISGVYTPLPHRCEVVQYDGVPYLRYEFTGGNHAAIEMEFCGVMTRMQFKSDFFGETNAALIPTMDLIHMQNQGIKEGVESAASYRFMAKVGNFTKIGNNSINTNIYNGNSVDVQNIIAKEMTVGEPTASTPYYISSSSSAIQLVCGGHVLSVDSTGVKVDGRSI